MSGLSSAEGFPLQTGGQEQRELDVGCLRCFAYWDSTFLESERLLNPQTGELVDVEIRSLGDDVVLIDQQQSRRRPADPGWVSRAKRAVPEGSSAL